jgi:hypothetical protein
MLMPGAVRLDIVYAVVIKAYMLNVIMQNVTALNVVEPSQ